MIDHVGVSALRHMNAQWLRYFNQTDTVYVIHDGADPIAVLVPYAFYMELQEAVTRLRSEAGAR